MPIRYRRMKMKGVILAGGTGKRLFPLTKVLNKHLLPIYDRPMIFYPLELMAKAGIDEVLLVTGGQNASDFERLLGDGSDFGLKSLQYAYQPQAGGVAQALGLAEEFAAGSPVCLILGDTLLEFSVHPAAEHYRQQGGGARILLKQVDDPSHFGVAIVDEPSGHVTRIIEKPTEPFPSNLAVIGVYFYDEHVFEIVRGLKPSSRGELEITDVNNAYIARGTMKADRISGYWADAGEDIDAYLQACNTVARLGANKDLP